jgi:uncharacterized membrane protein YuzA (DUF378 family)
MPIVLGQTLDKFNQQEIRSMKKLDVVTAVLLVVGGLNWGLVGAAQVNLVATLFGDMSALSRIVYLLVGVAALYQAAQWRGIQRRWAEPARVRA